MLAMDLYLNSKREDYLHPSYHILGPGLNEEIDLLSEAANHHSFFFNNKSKDPKVNLLSSSSLLSHISSNARSSLSVLGLAALFVENISVIFLESVATFCQYAFLLRNVDFASPLYTGSREFKV